MNPTEIVVHVVKRRICIRIGRFCRSTKLVEGSFGEELGAAAEGIQVVEPVRD